MFSQTRGREWFAQAVAPRLFDIFGRRGFQGARAALLLAPQCIEECATLEKRGPSRGSSTRATNEIDFAPDLNTVVSAVWALADM